MPFLTRPLFPTPNVDSGAIRVSKPEFISKSARLWMSAATSLGILILSSLMHRKLNPSCGLLSIKRYLRCLNFCCCCLSYRIAIKSKRTLLARSRCMPGTRQVGSRIDCTNLQFGPNITSRASSRTSRKSTDGFRWLAKFKQATMASGVNVWVTVPSRRSDARLTTKDAFDESGTFYINEKMSMHVVCLAKNSHTIV